MRELKAGDQVIGQNHKYAIWRNGMCGVVVEVLPEPVPRFDFSSDYLVAWSDGTTWPAACYHLRKRRPPEQDDQLFTRWFRDHIITEPLIETARRIHPSVEEINRKAYAPGWLGDANG